MKKYFRLSLPRFCDHPFEIAVQVIVASEMSCELPTESAVILYSCEAPNTNNRTSCTLVTYYKTSPVTVKLKDTDVISLL